MSCGCIGNYHEPNVDWLIAEIKKALEEWNLTENEWKLTKQYIDNYFNNLNVTDEINEKLDEMANDGTLAAIIDDQFYKSIRNSYNKRGTCIIMADSYGLGTTSGGIETSWTTKLADLLSPFYDDVIISNTDGGGMSTGLDNEKQFSVVLSNIAPKRGKADVSMIICCGGINDAWNFNENNVITGVGNFSEVVYEQFPNALAFIGCVSFSTNSSVWANWMRVVQCWKMTHDYVSTIYIPGSETILCLNRFISEDKTHPTVTGQNQISNFLFWTLRSGFPATMCYNHMDIIFTPAEGVEIQTAAEANLLDGDLTIDTTGIIINFNSAMSIQTDLVSYKPVLGTWACDLMLPVNAMNFNILTAGYYKEGGTNKPCTASLLFNSNGNFAIGILGTDCNEHNITQIVLAPIKKTFNIRNY